MTMATIELAIFAGLTYFKSDSASIDSEKQIDSSLDISTTEERIPEVEDRTIIEHSPAPAKERDLDSVTDLHPVTSSPATEDALCQRDKQYMGEYNGSLFQESPNCLASQSAGESLVFSELPLKE